MNPLRFATFALAIVPLVATAAENAASATMRCRVFAVGKAPPGDIYVRTGDKYRTVAVSSDYVGPSVRLEAGKDGFVFYRKISGGVGKPDEPSKDRYEAVAACQPDGKSVRQLIFMAPAGKGWTATAKADDTGSFPVGTRLFFNLSSTQVGIDFGGTRLVLNPRQSGLLGAAKSAPEGLARVRMVRHAKSGEWVPFLSSVWRQTTDERAIMLIHQAEGTEDVLITGVPDRLEAPDEIEKQAEKKASGRSGQ